MEESVSEMGMTDNQWDMVIRAMMKVANNCKTGKEVVRELYDLIIKKGEGDKRYLDNNSDDEI